MRVLVCGGTGVLGRHLVPALSGRGHAVTVLARSDAAADTALALGTRVVRGDLLRPDTLRPAMLGQDVVVHAATRLPRVLPGRPADFAPNDRLRREGTQHLLAAAEAAGVRRVVLQSIIWVHGDQGDAWIDEDAPLRPGPLAQSAVDLETQARRFVERTGTSVAILRCGAFYDAESWHTREILERLRHRRAPIIGHGDNYQSFVHAADAGAAFAAATESAATGPLFITDDEPVRLGEYLGWLARAVGAHAPLHLPHFIARVTLGHDMTAAYSSSLRCRNARARERLGWVPRYATFRDGYAEVLPQLHGR